MKKQITFFIEEKTREKFSQKYSLNMSKFLRNCVILAINDSTFFKDILFLNEINKLTIRRKQQSKRANKKIFIFMIYL